MPRGEKASGLFARFSRAAVCGVAACLAACAASPRVPTLVEWPQPLALARDERELWRIAEEVEGRVLQGEKLLGDARLDAYVEGIAEQLLRAAGAPEQVQIRARITSDARPDAFVLVNGALYVSTGLLARLENEAQLAALLGHELIHYLRRDTLRRERARDPEWSRMLETEADLAGLTLMTAAGYRPDQAIVAYQRLLAGTAPRRAMSQRATHPPLAERIARLAADVEERYGARAASGEEGREAYLQRMLALPRGLNAAAPDAGGSAAAPTAGERET